MRMVIAMLIAGCGSTEPVTPDAPAGSNAIAGSVAGKAFDRVLATLWIGSSDNPDTDTVIYLFDAPIACAEITQAGWDTAIATGTQILEVKMVGKAPRAFPTTTSATHIPAAGESLSSYTVAAAGASDMIATGGTVTLATLEPAAAGHFATGTFQLQFGSGDLTGAFASPFCASGREP